MLFLTGYALTVQDTHLALGADALTDWPHLLLAFFFSHIFLLPCRTAHHSQLSSMPYTQQRDCADTEQNQGDLMKCVFQLHTSV
jgi:hypothetical protein